MNFSRFMLALCFGQLPDVVLPLCNTGVRELYQYAVVRIEQYN